MAKKHKDTKRNKRYSDLLGNIYRLLEKYPDGLDYMTIAESISSRYESVSPKFGQYVNNKINDDIRNSDNPIFERASESGSFKIRQHFLNKSKEEISANITQAEERVDESDNKIKPVFPCFGMYWDRNLIAWETDSQLLGSQYYNSQPINFTNQKGVYVLYHDRDLIYIGQAFDRSIFTRLREHTQQRLRSRWNRFSWFGIYDLNETGVLDTSDINYNYESNKIIDGVESLLIEICEPPQNRKKGDDKSAEYMQVMDPIAMESRTRAVQAISRY